MKVYKTKNYLVFLLGLLFLSSVFFGVSNYFAADGSMSGGKIAVLVFLSVFILFNLIVVTIRKTIISEDTMNVKTLFTNKTINLNEIQDLGVIRLKGRYSVLVYDNNNFCMLPSTLNNFHEIIETLKEKGNGEIKESLKELGEKTLKNQIFISLLFLIAANAFLISFGFYNLFIK